MKMSTGTALLSDSQGVRNAAQFALEELGQAPALTIVFAWAQADLSHVLSEVGAVVGDCPVVGCTTFGELTNAGAGSQTVAIAMLSSDDISVAVGVGRGLHQGDLSQLVQSSILNFRAQKIDEDSSRYPGRTLFLFTDGLSGRGEELVNELMLQTQMRYQLFGGAAADDAKFVKTGVFYNGEVLEDAFVCVEVLSVRPFGISLSHGWKPSGDQMRVTKSVGATLFELNGEPVMRAYERLAEQKGIQLTPENTAGFLMDNIIGIVQNDGFRLRVPLAPNPDGSIFCAAEVPQGSVVRFLVPNDSDILSGGETAIRAASNAIGNCPVTGVLCFECAATRLRLGENFSEEVRKSVAASQPAAFFGGVSFGQLSRVEGSFSGLMDASSLVCVIPE